MTLRMLAARATVALFASVAFSGTARADLIVNGGFETGDFTGWTATSNNVGELTVWTVASNGGWFSDATPLAGTYSAFNGFDGSAGQEYQLYQDVFIPTSSA